MALETASYPSQLNPANPSGSDRIHQGDDHIRLLKAVLKATFPNITGPVTLTQGQINAPFQYPIGIISAFWGTADAVPEGWAVCNGQTVARSDGNGNITLPNLVNRTIFGAGGLYNAGQAIGAASATVETGEAGGHQHTIAGGSHTHEVQVSSTTSGNPTLSTTTVAVENEQRQETVLKTASITPAGAHTHTATAEAATHTHTVSTEGAHKHSVSVSTIPPALGLHWIMKV